MADPSSVPGERALAAAFVSVAAGAAAAAGATFALPVELNFRVSGVFDQTVRELTRTAAGFVLGAFAGAGAVWLLSARKAAHDFRPGLVTLGAATGGLLGVVASSMLTAVLVAPIANRAGAPGSAPFLRVLAVGRWILLLPPLAGAFLLALRAARGSVPKPARAFERWVRVVLPPLALVAALAVLLRPPAFPSDAPPEARDSWARQTFPAHYPAAAELARRAPFVLAQVGTVSAVAPAAGTENRVFFGPDGSAAVFTLDVTGELGAGRLRVALKAPASPPGASPVPGAVAWTAGGRTTELDAEGRAPSGR